MHHLLCATLTRIIGPIPVAECVGQLQSFSITNSAEDALWRLASELLEAGDWRMVTPGQVKLIIFSIVCIFDSHSSK
jgi:hypothetical protein